MQQKVGADRRRQVAGEQVAAVDEVEVPPHDGDSATRKAALDALPEASAVGVQDETLGGSGLAEVVTELPGCCCTEVRFHEGIRVVEVEVSVPRKHAEVGHTQAFASVPVPEHLQGVNTAAGAVPFAACLAAHIRAGAWHVAFQDRRPMWSSPSFLCPVVPFPSLASLARTSACPLRA